MSLPLDFVSLSLLPFRWWRETVILLRGGKSPDGILEQFAARRPTDTRSAIDVSALRSRALRAIARAHVADVAAIAWGDPLYPAALSAIVDPPPILWVRGSPDALQCPSVAIVGSRAGSPYAVAVAERLAGDLAARGLTIVSGLARGVDSAAHRGALAAPGPTVAVLGSGADVVYPGEQKPLASEILGSGAIVSELAPGTMPRPYFFPRRNRIISGLARAVVVVEAGERSGSLITARCALEQGRDVLAVPGNVLNGRNRGGHALLRDGAKIVESADDILEEVGWPSGGSTSGERDGAMGGRGSTSVDPVLASLPPGEACDLDVIADRSGLSPSRLLPRLFELELGGFVRRVGGGRFMRFDKSFDRSC